MSRVRALLGTSALLLFIQACADVSTHPVVQSATASQGSPASLIVPCSEEGGWQECPWTPSGYPAGAPWPFFGPPGDSIYQAPNDPSPGSPGIWLGANVTPEVCFNDRNQSITDADRDWLDDTCEEELAKGFAPTWEMSRTDGCPGGEPLWAAKYFRSNTVRIAFLPAYYDDCGGGSPFDHRGDSEFVMVQVSFNNATRHWEFDVMWTSAHYEGGANDRSRWVDRDQATFLRRPLAHPQVVVAINKHSNYPNVSVCENPTFHTDSCATDNYYQKFRFPIVANRNVGSRHVALVPCIGSNGALINSGRNECFYSASQSFCGWHPTNTPCPEPYRTLLMSPMFEANGADWGPGPEPFTSSPPPSGPQPPPDEPPPPPECGWEGNWCTSRQSGETVVRRKTLLQTGGPTRPTPIKN